MQKIFVVKMQFANDATKYSQLYFSSQQLATRFAFSFEAFCKRHAIKTPVIVTVMGSDVMETPAEVDELMKQSFFNLHKN